MMQIKNQTLSFNVETVFSKVQFSKKSNYGAYKKILTDIYKKSNFEEFLTEFLKCLKICLMHEEKSPNVETTLDFAAEFAVSFISNLNDDESCPLLEGVFQFIFDNHDCHIQLVRLRICQLMNRLLDNMGHDATVLEETYSKIAENMLMRLQDSMTSVRTQAVYALHRLQSPNDPNCDITKAFIFHMTHDPCYEVRRAIIQKIAVNKVTLASILTRMNDVKDIVRKEAYVIISKFLIRQFTTKQRQLILESGLGDRSEIARDYVTGVLVPNWLKYFNYNYYEFLECIHVEKIPETGIKLLKTIFAKHHDVILESRVKDMWITNKKIPYNKLNMISVVYWRALAEFVKPTDENDKYEHIFQQVLPDLTPFCHYIRGYFFPSEVTDTSSAIANQQSVVNEVDNGSDMEVEEELKMVVDGESEMEVDNQGGSKTDIAVKEEPHVPSEAVLVHLLEMCKIYDLADEMGRMSVKQLCVDFLQSPNVTGESIPVLAGLLNHVIPSVTTKLSVMAEIITELREPLQADNSVYVPDLLLIEAEEKKYELAEKIKELETEMEIARELSDGGRVEEIKFLLSNLEEELKIMNNVTPHEPGRNMNNDTATLKKCLTIVVQVMKSGKVQKMDPTLYSLMQNFIIPTLSLEIDGDGAALVKNLALQALGIFSILDIELAKEHFMMFCFNIANEVLSLTALKSVFDLLHVYGLSSFNLEDPYKELTAQEDSIENESRKSNMILLLVSLINSKSAEMRKTAVIGLSRLLLAGRIKSPDLVSKLIVLWYNPVVECDPHIRQPLGVFFRVFASNCNHAPELLLKAFIPTLKEFFKLEVTDPLAEVDVESVANLFVELTRPGINNKIQKDFSVHNQLAITICEELLGEEYENANCALLLKVMHHLELNFQLSTDISILTALVTRLLKILPKDDKPSLRLATKFETMLKVKQDKNQSVSTVCNTLSPETTISSSTSRLASLLLPSKDVSESESDAEQEEVLSEDDTICRVNNISEAMVICGTPESSYSESEETSEDSSPPKIARLSPPEFKRPETPPLHTPFKGRTKTPKRTPASSSVSDTSEISFIKPSQNTPAKTPGSTRTRSSGRTPSNQNMQIDQPPQRKFPERVTRSGRKRRS